jgi:hypothetical protein
LVALEIAVPGAPRFGTPISEFSRGCRAYFNLSFSRSRNTTCAGLILRRVCWQTSIQISTPKYQRLALAFIQRVWRKELEICFVKATLWVALASEFYPDRIPRDGA